MLQHDTVYKPGTRTYVYFIFKYGWWLIALGLASAYFAFAISLGNLNVWMTQFLGTHADWYIDTGMLTQWSILVALSFWLIAYMRVAVMYRQRSFYIDDHAFHLRRGLIRIQEITVPYKQISNVHIEQPYHWRLFGLAQLDITISSSNSGLRTHKRKEFLLPCIDKSLAKELSHYLIQQASGEGPEAADFDEDEDDDGEDISIEKGH